MTLEQPTLDTEQERKLLKMRLEEKRAELAKIERSVAYKREENRRMDRERERIDALRATATPAKLSELIRQFIQLERLSDTDPAASMKAADLKGDIEDTGSALELSIDDVQTLVDREKKRLKEAALGRGTTEKKDSIPVETEETFVTQSLEMEKELTSKMPEEHKETLAKNDYEDYKELFKKDHKDEGIGNIFEVIESTIPNFGDMKPSARLLLVKTLTDRLLTELSERAQEKLNTQKADLGVFGKVKDGKGIFRKFAYWAAQKLGTTINNIRYGSISREFLLDEYKQEFLGTMTEEKLAEFVNEHKGKAKTIAELDQPVVLSRDKRSIYIDFAGQEQETGLNAEIAQTYNKRAETVRGIPRAWTEDDAKPSEKRAYQKALKELGEAEVAMSGVFLERMQGDKEEPTEEDKIAASILSGKKHYEIEAMRLLTENRDAAETLRAIATRTRGERIDNAIIGFFKEKYTGTNLKYALSGGTARTAIAYAVAGTALAGTAFALPIAAGVAGTIGYFRGKDLAQEGFRKERQENQKREKGTSREKDGVSIKRSATQEVSSQALIKTHRLKSLTIELSDLVANGGDIVRIAELSNQLETNFNYTLEKLNAGLINFGGEHEILKTKDGGTAEINSVEKDRFMREYDLAMAMHEASVTLETLKLRKKTDEIFRTAANLDRTRDENSEDERYMQKQARPYAQSDTRRQNMLASLEEKTAAEVKSAREKETRRSAWESAKIGAAFGSLGAFFAKWIHGAEAPAHGAGTNPASRLTMEELLDRKIRMMTGNPTALAREAFVSHKLSIEDIRAHSMLSIKASDKGIGEMILELRDSNVFKHLGSLTKDQRAFFENNEYAIAEKLRLFNQETKESVLLAKGSSVGMTSDGYLYVVDQLHPNIVHTLGRLDADGTLVPSDDIGGLRFIDAEGHIREIAGHTQKLQPDLNRNGQPDGESITPVPYETNPNFDNSDLWREAGEAAGVIAGGEAISEAVRTFVRKLDEIKATSIERLKYNGETAINPVPKDPYMTLPESDEAIIEILRENKTPDMKETMRIGKARFNDFIEHNIPKINGKPATEQPAWKAVNTMSAIRYLSLTGIARPEFAVFQQKVKALAAESNIIPEPGESVGTYLKRIFIEQATTEQNA